MRRCHRPQAGRQQSELEGRQRPGLIQIDVGDRRPGNVEERPTEVVDRPAWRPSLDYAIHISASSLDRPGRAVEAELIANWLKAPEAGGQKRRFEAAPGAVVDAAPEPARTVGEAATRPIQDDAPVAAPDLDGDITIERTAPSEPVFLDPVLHILAQGAALREKPAPSSNRPRDNTAALPRPPGAGRRESNSC